jgi:hypothetical protein
MARRSVRRVGLAAALFACALASTAHAQTPPVIDTTGGKTQPFRSPLGFSGC